MYYVNARRISIFISIKRDKCMIYTDVCPLFSSSRIVFDSRLSCEYYGATAIFKFSNLTLDPLSAIKRF